MADEKIIKHETDVNDPLVSSDNFKKTDSSTPAVSSNEKPVFSPAAFSPDDGKPMSPDDIAALLASMEPPAETKAPEPAPPAEEIDPNKPMSPDDIAALLASMEPPAETKAPEPAPPAEEIDPNKPMSPDDIAALLASMEPPAETKVPEPAPTEEIDPNKPMSPDDIAALLASMEPPAETKVPEPAPPAEEIDPNKPMSPDDIAALLASMEPPADAEKPEVETKPRRVAAMPKEKTPQASPVEEIDPNKPMSPDDIAALLASMEPPAETKAPEPAPPAEEIDPNKPMSPDDIAALLASMEPPAETNAPEPAPPAEEIDPNKPMSPDDIAALLASMEPPAETNAPEPAPPAEEIDPNKPMSPDDIAALLASMEPPAETNAPEPAPVEEIDPNKPMSPDDIAALLASMEPPAETNAPEPAPVEEIDPNKPMSPDDIAALLASMEPPAETNAPEPAPVEEIDPNKPMSPDDIAALLASMEPPAETNAPEPAPAEEIDPNKPMSPDDIAALLASMEPPADPEKPEPETETKAKRVAAIPKEKTPQASEAEESDPNKPMSPNDIAALLASMDAPSVEKEPEPAALPVEEVDPNKQMSPDDIAALLNQMNATETTAPEKTTTPEAEEEKTLDPNEMASLLKNIEILPDDAPVAKKDIDASTKTKAALEKEGAMDHWEIKELVNTVISSHEQENKAKEKKPEKTSSFWQKFRVLLAGLFVSKSLPQEKATAAPQSEAVTPNSTEAVAPNATAGPSANSSAPVAEVPAAENKPENPIEKTTENLKPTETKKKRFRVPLLKRSVLFILLGFLSVAGIGGLLGYYSSKAKTDVLSPLEKVVNLGITFEEKSMVMISSRGDKAMVQSFLDAGMDVNAVRKSDGWTPLMGAAFFKKADTVKLLLTNGANPNLQDNAGRTALMQAANVGAEDIVDLLLDNGANPNIQDKFGRTALSDAYRKQEARIAELLKAAGADPNLMPETSKPQLPLAGLPPGNTAGKGSGAPITATPADPFALGVGKAGEIHIGLPFEDLQKKFSNVLLSSEIIDGERTTLAVIYPDNNKKNPPVKIQLSSGKIRLVSIINIYDPNYKTDKKIGVGSTIEDVRSQYAISDVRIIDGVPFMVVKSLRMMFEIEVGKDSPIAEWMRSGSISALPGDIRIKRIMLY